MPIIQDVYQTFQTIFEGREIVIAGGAARDTLRGKTPKDYDVFILNQQFDDWKAFLSHQGQEFKDKLAKFEKVQAANRILRIFWIFVRLSGIYMKIRIY